MKLGTEDKKKVGALAVLAVVGGYLLYSNVLSEPSAAPRSAEPAPAAGAAAARAAAANSLATPGGGSPAPGASLKRATPGRANKGDEFHPTIGSKRPEDRVDPATIDPTLRLDLLAKVQKLAEAGGARNIFQFGTAPPPVTLAKVEPKVLPKPFIGPKEPPPPEVKRETPKPPPAPINLKYYGFSSPAGGSRKTAFFLDGDEILVAAEGETVKKRYKVVRIGVNSVMMEDTQGGNQQSLPLQEDVVGVGG